MSGIIGQMSADFFRDVTLRRFAPGSYIDGSWANGSMTTSTIKASVQAATQRDIQLLDEGRRNNGAIVLWTAVSIKGIDEGAAQSPDQFSIDGDLWEARSVENLPYLDIAHYRVVASKIKEDAP